MAAKAPQFEVFNSGDGWNWHLRAKNGEIIAQGSQGYESRADCVAACQLVHRTLRRAKIEVLGWVSL